MATLAGTALDRYQAVRLIAARQVWAATTQADLDRYEVERVAHGYDPPYELTLHTRVPSKWLVVDRETGERWEWRDDAWRAAIAPEVGEYGYRGV